MLCTFTFSHQNAMNSISESLCWNMVDRCSYSVKHGDLDCEMHHLCSHSALYLTYTANNDQPHLQTSDVWIIYCETLIYFSRITMMKHKYQNSWPWKLQILIQCIIKDFKWETNQLNVVLAGLTQHNMVIILFQWSFTIWVIVIAFFKRNKKKKNQQLNSPIFFSQHMM